MADRLGCRNAQSQLEVQRQRCHPAILATQPDRLGNLPAARGRAQFDSLAAAERERVERERDVALVAQRDRDARDMGLSSWAQRPRELISQLHRYDGELQIVQRDLIDIVNSLDDQTQADAARTPAEAALAIAQETRRTATGDVQQQQVELATLTQTLGVAAAEITAKIDAEKQKLQDAKKRCEQHLRSFAEAQGRAESQQSLIAIRRSEIEQCDEQRREAVACLQQRAELGLIEVAEFDVDTPASPWNLTQGVEVARLVHRAGDEQQHDDEAWSRSQVRIHEHARRCVAFASYDLTPEPESSRTVCNQCMSRFAASCCVSTVARQLDEETAAHGART